MKSTVCIVLRNCLLTDGGQFFFFFFNNALLYELHIPYESAIQGVVVQWFLTWGSGFPEINCLCFIKLWVMLYFTGL